MENRHEELIGLISAAGKGTRLGLPFPKELYPIIEAQHFKPVTEFVVENLKKVGLRHIVFVINETKHQLIGYFSSGRRFDCEISYVAQEPFTHALTNQVLTKLEQDNIPAITINELRKSKVKEFGTDDELLKVIRNLLGKDQAEKYKSQILAQADITKWSTSPGLALALDSAHHLVCGKTVFFGMADTIMKPKDVFKQAYDMMSINDDVLLILFETKRHEKFGMVQLGKDKTVEQIVDKPKRTSLTHMWGAIIWRPVFTEYLHRCIKEENIFDFAQVMNSAIKEEKLRFRGFCVDKSDFVDLGTYEEISEIYNTDDKVGTS